MLKVMNIRISASISCSLNADACDSRQPKYRNDSDSDNERPSYRRVRVLQKNLVYVVGLTDDIATTEVLPVLFRSSKADNISAGMAECSKPSSTAMR